MANNNLEKKIDKQIKVLIVDDETSILDSISDLCDDNNFSYKISKSGEDAFKITKNYNPDVILLDIKLPGIDGIEIVQKIVNYDKYSQIILMTGGIIADDEIDKALNYGVRGFIQKPLDFNIIKLRIKSFANAKKEYKRIEKEFIRSKEQIEIISNNSPDFYFSVNHLLNITYINNSLPQFNKNKLIGKNFISLVEKSQRYKIKNKLNEILKTGKKEKIEICYKKNSKLINYYEAFALRFNKKNKKYGIHLYARDITDVKKLQQDKIEYEKEQIRLITANTLHTIISQKMFTIGGYHTLVFGNISKDNENYKHLKKMGEQINILNDEIKKYTLENNFKKIKHHKGNYILKPVDE
ncbi:response regulator [Candidatus Woesearchaeota archaeon]|jgi:YesN/AraC family two-component response regulator|nr:response regulator [Candidatus Woesearchaeota archaeon]